MQHKLANWGVLQGSPDLEGADVALLCEAAPAPPDVHALGEGRTIGLEAPLLPDRPVDRPWSTAVASPHPLRPIADARVARPFKDRPRLPFEPLRPGTWTAASVEIDGLNVTAISLYGLIDERSDASVHRSLSELSPIFDHEEYGKHLLLGGDLNVFSNPRPGSWGRDRHLLVLKRIGAYGLVDCLEQALRSRGSARGGLVGCPCGLGDECFHTWTKLDPQRPTVAYQDDYLFASRRLAERLESCEGLPFDERSTSDHAPIVATFGV